VDRTDLKILDCLRKNARETLTKISGITGVPISSIFDRLKRLEGSGVIIRHTSLLDMKKLGFNTRIFLFLKLRRDETGDLERFLSDCPHVNNMTRVNGDWSLIAEALFRNIQELESFMEKLKMDFNGIEVSLQYVLEELKRESFLTGMDISETGGISC